MKFHVVIEVDVPDEEVKPSTDVFDEFSPTTWASALLETAFAKMGGPQKHPYRPHVVESYAVLPGMRHGHKP